MQMGNQPDPTKVRSVADELATALSEWEVLIERMRLSDDFQSREYFKMTQAHMEDQGSSFASIGLGMRWQIDSMRAFAAGAMPPMPPPGLDLAAMSQQQQSGAGGGMASAMGGPPAIDTTPFAGMESAFESEVVRDEYERLCRDHAQLIGMGSAYGTFDPLGKLAYLDALEAVEARWDTFFARFSLMGTLNADFRDQCSAFLRSMGLTPAGFRGLLSSAHDIMRRDAEEERRQAA